MILGLVPGDADGGQARLVKHRTAGHSHAGTVGTQHQADILAHQLRRGGGRLVGSGTVVRVDQLHVVGGATDVHRGGLLIGILHTQHLLLAAGTGVAGGGLEHTDADHIPPAAPESPVDVSPLPPQAARLRAMTIARASARTLFMLLFLLSMVKDRCSLMYERHFTGFFQALQDE